MSAKAETGPADMPDTPSPHPSDRAPATTSNAQNPARRSGDRLTTLAYATRGGLAVLAIVVGVLIFLFLRGTKAPPARSDLGSALLQVLTFDAHARPTARVWEGFGTARAMTSTDVRAQVSGAVIERPDAVEAGAEIGEGDTIIKIEPLDYAERISISEQRAGALEAQLSGLEVEEARLGEQLKFAVQEQDAARRDFQRVREAIAAGAGSPGELDQFESALLRSQRTLEGIRQQVEMIPSRRARLAAQLTGEQSTLRIERENLARTVVTSPIEGVLQAIDFERGEWVGAAQRVARVVDLRRIEIPLRLAMSANGSVKIGDRVELRSDGPGASVWSGRVVRIAPEIDRATRTLEIFVEVVQDPATEARPLLPGQFVVGRVWTSATSERVVLPRRAVVADRVMLAEPIEAGDASIEGFDRNEGGELRRVRPAEVRVDYHLGGTIAGSGSDDRDWAVLDPGGAVPEGSAVILSNLDQLTEGMLVRLAPAPGGRANGSD